MDLEACYSGRVYLEQFLLGKGVFPSYPLYEPQLRRLYSAKSFLLKLVETKGNAESMIPVNKVDVAIDDDRPMFVSSPIPQSVAD